MRISDWSSDVCSSDLVGQERSLIMELKLLNDQGQSASTVAAPDTIFGRDFNEALVHQIVAAFRANARSGNRAQKGRDTVKHSRSEERRVGKECVHTCRSGWSPTPNKKKI